MSKKVAARRRDAFNFMNAHAADAPLMRPKSSKEAKRLALWEKPFVVWDGEGAKMPGRRKPQNYVLFGCYNGDTHEYVQGEQLTTIQLLTFIIEQAEANPNAWHISFAFGYDVDMILRHLTVRQFVFLRERGYCKVGDNFRIEHIPGKWFRVTRYGPAFPVIRKDRKTVTIFDSWGFFQSSLVRALRTTIPDHPLMSHLAQIEQGKNERKNFTYDKIDFIRDYWKIENELFHALVNRLRDMLYSVGLFITSWHGPGALASYAYRQNGVKPHKSDCGPEIYDAARYAYAGGRFERFQVGRFEQAFGYDINSAYPYAISQLPSLTEGHWQHVDRPTNFVEFGVYRVRMRGPAIKRAPSPLFHRDATGTITYPWRLDGWYWSPELIAMSRALPDFESVEILEGWEYVGWETRPFAFVKGLYEERRKMKSAGDGAQMALKLLLNSLYGKMAQRAGWERTGKAPTWHQLEWAGWVTSFTRAMLFEVMARVPFEKLIAVETDGLFTTATPEELGIEHSTELGGWDITAYDEIVYLQSGVYAKRQSEDWSIKFRGLDNDSFGETTEQGARAIAEHARKLGPSGEWPNIVGTTTRFIGYRNALFRQEQNRGPMKVHHCVWETEPREISCGSIGKRIHSPKICRACRAGRNAYDLAHETIIKSRAMIAGDEGLMSCRHEIPWLDGEDRHEWRKRAEEFEGKLIVG